MAMMDLFSANCDQFIIDVNTFPMRKIFFIGWLTVDQSSDGLHVADPHVFQRRFDGHENSSTEQQISREDGQKGQPLTATHFTCFESLYQVVKVPISWIGGRKTTPVNQTGPAIHFSTQQHNTKRFVSLGKKCQRFAGYLIRSTNSKHRPTQRKHPCSTPFRLALCSPTRTLVPALVLGTEPVHRLTSPDRRRQTFFPSSWHGNWVVRVACG